MSVCSLNRFVLMFGVYLVIGFPSAVLSQIYFDTAADSKLWLEGSSTVHRFDCVARSIQGTAFIEDDQDMPGVTAAGGADPEPSVLAQNQITVGSDVGLKTGNITNRNSGQRAGRESDKAKLHVLLEIPIKSFDCGRSRMNNDMYDALKSDTYEYITFEFESAQPIENENAGTDPLFDDGYKPYLIEGVLNVAGVDRMVTLTVRGRPEEQSQYRIKGEKKISMKDYEVEPPTALRGLIRAHEDLTVFFDLVVVQIKS